ncbi:GNAT family N-acetyltransferase [Paenibacillus silvisoli]|uniref:GNAT family N-acetyltransferase n=1 Tax=Paenibacillus silvisoli TaxID=3110539 RepID=UPI0028059601|nr:GNAT family N-acetyltransferase [Paenibacillus silvisoli]
MEIAIRSAKQEDYEALLPLFWQVHHVHVVERPDLYKVNAAPVGEELFQRQLEDDQHHLFVAVLGDAIVGVVVARVDETIENSFVNARKVLLVDSLCVADTVRKKGIGRKLMQHVFELANALNVDSVELGVSETNQQALRFYESIGMTTKSRKMELRLTE